MSCKNSWENVSILLFPTCEHFPYKIQIFNFECLKQIGTECLVNFTPTWTKTNCKNIQKSISHIFPLIPFNFSIFFY